MLLWALGFEGSLPAEARTQIEQQADDVLVSAASAWELAVKRSINRLRIDADLRQLTAESGFHELPVTFEHAEAVADLPPHHGDPFDRMLVAQARIEGLTLATADPVIGRYDVPVLEVARG